MEKKKNLICDILENLKKDHGEEAIATLTSKPKTSVNVISTGLFSLDKALGVNGIPKGRIIEIYGPESSGKTTLCLEIINQAQKANMNCAFIDAEHSLDPSYAKKIGVNIENLIFSQPDSGEQALSIAQSLIKTNAVDLIIVDSVASLVPQVELDGQMHEHTIGAQARLMSKALRKMSGILNKFNCTIIFINQIRMKIGVMFGNPETTPGGRALKFYSSIRMEIRGSSKITNGSNIIGNEVKIKIVKNKLAPPYKTVLTSIEYGKGFDNDSDIIKLAIANNVIKKSGSWYSYKNNKIGQGLLKVKNWLNEKTQIKNQIIKSIK